MATKGFLEQLWGGIDRGRILIWTLEGKKSRWFANAAEAEKAVLSLERDVYVGVGLAERDLGPSKRCKAEEVIAIPGLWADLDIAHPIHKKPNLPPDLLTARKILASSGLRPTLVVATGHGLQAWWLFKEPWFFDGSTERKRAAAAEVAWLRFLAGKAEEAGGYSIDLGVSDLARVLRVAGTLNCKVPDKWVKVEVIDGEGPRYPDISDFESLVDTARSVRPIPIPLPEVRAVFSADAAPPMDMFEQLHLSIPKFRATWERRRTDFKDHSASAYCWALCMYAVKAGWTDQQCVDLMIAWRRKHKEPLDLDRPEKYLKYTIGRLRRELEIEEAVDVLASLRPDVESTPSKSPGSSPGEGLAEIAASETGDGAGKGGGGSDGTGESKDDSPEERKRKLLSRLSTALQVPLRSFRQHSRHSAIFSFVLDKPDNEEIIIGPVRKLFEVDTVLEMIVERMQVAKPEISRRQWRVIANKLIGIVELVVPEAGDVRKELPKMIEEYAWNRRTRYSDEGDVDNTREAIARRLPFFRGGYIYVNAGDLRGYLDQRSEEVGSDDKITQRRLTKYLTYIGFSQHTVKDAEHDSSRSYWSMPIDEFRKLVRDGLPPPDSEPTEAKKSTPHSGDKEVDDEVDEEKEEKEV